MKIKILYIQSFKLLGLISILSLSENSFAQLTKLGVQQGQKFYVETLVKGNTSATVMGQTMDGTTESKSTTLYEILGAGPDGIDLQRTITKMRFDASMMGQNTSFDSDKKDNEGPLADTLSKKINKAITFTLDAKGTIIKREVMEDGSIGNAMGVPGSGQEPVTDLFILALIGRELKAGESFIDSLIVKKEKYESYETGTYTITAIDNGIADIAYTGTQVTSVAMIQMEMEMVSAANNVIKSQLQLDIKTGVVLARTTVMESIISTEIAGMSLPSSGTTTTSIKISPVL